MSSPKKAVNSAKAPAKAAQPKAAVPKPAAPEPSKPRTTEVVTKLPSIAERSARFGVNLKRAESFDAVETPAVAAAAAAATATPPVNPFLKANSATSLGPRNPFSSNPKAVVETVTEQQLAEKRSSLSAAFARRASDPAGKPAARPSATGTEIVAPTTGARCRVRVSAVTCRSAAAGREHRVCAQVYCRPPAAQVHRLHVHGRVQPCLPRPRRTAAHARR